MYLQEIEYPISRYFMILRRVTLACNIISPFQQKARSFYIIKFER